MPKHCSVYIGVGSNLEDPLAQVHRARSALDAHPELTLVSSSPLYRSRAVGPGNQPDYINGVFLCSTALPPEAVLDILQAVEQAQHRQRDERWGPRTIDLDLLLYEDQTISSPRLEVPHPRISERNFVLQPLIDIDPEIHLPDGRRAQDILHIIGLGGLQRLESSNSE